jgi:hypothetical protein
MILGTVTGNKICALTFSTNLSETFLILRRIYWDITINVCRFTCKVFVIVTRLYWNFNFLESFPKNIQVSDFIKILPLGTELNAGGQTNGSTGKQDEATGRSSQFCEPTYKGKFSSW